MDGCNTNPRISRSDDKRLIDKIPIDKFKQDPTEGLYKLGSICLTAAEFGFAESINQIIDELHSLGERITKMELR